MPSSTAAAVENRSASSVSTFVPAAYAYRAKIAIAPNEAAEVTIRTTPVSRVVSRALVEVGAATQGRSHIRAATLSSYLAGGPLPMAALVPSPHSWAGTLSSGGGGGGGV